MKLLNKYHNFFIDGLITRYIQNKADGIRKNVQHPIEQQQKVFEYLIQQGRKTVFGVDHNFQEINNYEAFKQNVPLRNYDQISFYIQKIIQGEKNVLWPGYPQFIAKTSGTTSTKKLIPVTRQSLRNQLRAPQYSAVNYALTNKTINHLLGKFLILSDGHFFEKIGPYHCAPISTIVYSQIPFLLSSLCLPPKSVNSIYDFDARMEALVKCTIGKDIRTIAAMPIWLLPYLRLLKTITGKNFVDNFPNFKLLITSGMNCDPYLAELKQQISIPFALLDSYPSTEGFIAYQNNIGDKAMQLVLNKGIFFEFVPFVDSELLIEKRISLNEVELNVEYAIVLNTDAGLWGYINGDTIKFTNLYPHYIQITGRVAEYISAFGEHITLQQTDIALSETALELDSTIVNYIVAPNFKNALPCHEWLIEFGANPVSIDEFRDLLEKKICQKNIAYDDLILKKTISPLQISVVRENGFIDFLRITGKTGFQHKLKHLNNDYNIASELRKIAEINN